MRAAGNDYVFYAGYTVLEYVVLACASGALRNDTGALWFKDPRIGSRRTSASARVSRALSNCRGPFTR